MKKKLPSATILFSIIFALNSCKSDKISIVRHKADVEQSRETGTGCFVEFNDGSVKNYNTLKLETGVLTTPYLLANRKIKIMGKDIKAYQTKDHYAISQKNFFSSHQTYVATETLPGFAIRIAKGTINVYARKYYNGVATADEYFIQRGGEGNIVAYSRENMNALARNEDPASGLLMAKKYNASRLPKDPAKTSYDNIRKTVTKNK